MDVRLVQRLLAMSLLTIFAVAGVGCSRHAQQDGPYAEAKQNWDSSHSSEQLRALRNRLTTTQQDH